MPPLTIVVLILPLSGLYKVEAADNFTPDCSNSSVDFVRHPTNCSRFYRCVYGSPAEYTPCSSDNVFSLSTLTCVPLDSSWNDCSQATTTTTPPATTTDFAQEVENRCQENQTAIFAHPSLCQLYYNCSNDAEPEWRSPFGKYMEECPYPQLFNDVTLRCEDYDDVTCRDRVEVVNACQYFRQSCPSHCYPCNLIYPSCEGLPDGNNAFAWKEWTSDYVVCKDNRTISTNHCPFNTTLNITEIFSPDRGDCVSLYQVPSARGGKPLNCTSKVDGLHPDEVTFRPDLYFRCDDGQLTEIAVCPSGEEFEDDSQQCVQS